MGYELHITRAEEWLDSESTPISQDEWLRVATDAGLAVMGSLDLEGIGPQDIYVASAAANAPGLHWHEGRIVVSGASEVDISPLLDLARALDAHLVGDDDEQYPLGTTVQAAVTKREWRFWRRQR
jgi:hypothetical protein